MNGGSPSLPSLPSVTVAVCTWNRAALLERTLASLEAQVASPGVEVLVVDNASTDETPAVIRRFAARLPLRGVREGEQGLSHARNAALAHASGDYIVFIDDDVEVAPGWLSAYRSAFREYPDAAMFGGPIRVQFLGTPPEWLVRAVDAVSNAYAIKDLGPDPRRLAPDALPYGANMAFRLDVARQHPYDPMLGRVGGSLIAGEETTVMSEMLAHPGGGWWVPGAALDHLMPPERQTLEYIGRYYRGLGRTYARTTGPVPGRFQVLDVPSWVWRSLVKAWVAYAATRWLAPVTTWMPWFRELATARGTWQAYRGSRAARRAAADAVRQPA